MPEQTTAVQLEARTGLRSGPDGSQPVVGWFLLAVVLGVAVATLHRAEIGASLVPGGLDVAPWWVWW